MDGLVADFTFGLFGTDAGGEGFDVGHVSGEEKGIGEGHPIGYLDI